MKAIFNIQLLTILVSLASCASIPENGQAGQFKTTGFVQGKMKHENNAWVVYESGSTLNFAENGSCVYNGATLPCMWHGFILSYETNLPKVVLDCTYTSSKSANFGNPNEVLSKNTNTFTYEMPLDGGKKQFINPQYIINKEPNSGVVIGKTSCLFQGSEVLRFQETIIYKSDEMQT